MTLNPEAVQAEEDNFKDLIQYFVIGRDFELLGREAGGFLSKPSMQLLEASISGNVSALLVEHPYVERDHRSVYYANLGKRHRVISRDSMRVHFFKDVAPDDLDPFRLGSHHYLGYVTLRDLVGRSIGTSYLSPEAVKGSAGYIMTTTYRAHVLGQELPVEAFPWMTQDTFLGRCAHVATWSIMRYLGCKQSWYPDRSLAEISELFTSDERKIPSDGLTVEQMSQVLTRLWFSPEIISREHLDGNPKGKLFDRALYCYIESGIPLAVALDNHHHAIALIGHGEVDSAVTYCKANGITKGIVSSSSLVREWKCSDDNDLPYGSLSVSGKPGPGKRGEYGFSDVTMAIVPLEDKMYLRPVDLLDYILPSFEEKSAWLGKGPLIRRVFLTSSAKLKNHAFEKLRGIDDVQMQVVLRTPLPRFVWVVEYSSPDEYDRPEPLCRFRVIVDATASMNDLDCLLIVASGSDILFKIPGVTSQLSERRAVSGPFPILQNNLLRYP